MKIHYRRNRAITCYDPEYLKTTPQDPTEPLAGPHAHCAGCPYPSHGFLCWGGSGECLRTAVQKIEQREENAHG